MSSTDHYSTTCMEYNMIKSFTNIYLHNNSGERSIVRAPRVGPPPTPGPARFLVEFKRGKQRDCLWCHLFNKISNHVIAFDQ